MGRARVAPMITAEVRNGKVFCGRPGCRQPALGRLEDVRHIAISPRWDWDAEVQPPRWRHEGHRRQRQGRIRGDNGEWIEMVYPKSSRDDEVPLPTVIECRCSAVNEVLGGALGPPP